MKQASVLICTSVAASVCFSGVLQAAEAQPVSWADLAPAQVEYDNPFTELSMDNVDGLRRLLQLRSRNTGDDAKSSQEAATLQAELEKSGLDVDLLFVKREQIIQIRKAAATGVNEAVLGRQVRLPGYVLPLEVKDYKAVEFLLVPTVGACIHTPPPPANQLIHVHYPQGIEVKGLYQPVWIQGQLAKQQTVKTVRYVDGSAKIEVSYFMEPIRVDPYRE
jgi:hypothetical protein